MTVRTGWGDHFCGLDSAGAAYCWGWNGAGQLGDGTHTDRNVPTAVTGGLTFANLAAGSQHTCGVTTSGDVYCWGVSVFGQLGDSTVGASHTSPTKARTPNGVVFTKVVAGGNFTCAATAGGDVYCWGVNTGGQLGDGTFTPYRSYPVLVTGAAKFPKARRVVDAGLRPDRYRSGVLLGQQQRGPARHGLFLNSATPVAVQGGLVFEDITVAWRARAAKRDPLETNTPPGAGASVAAGSVTERASIVLRRRSLAA